MSAIREEIDGMFARLIRSSPPIPFEPGVLGDCLRDELEVIWPGISDESRAVLLGIAICLKREYADGVVSDLIAAQTVSQLRGAA